MPVGSISSALRRFQGPLTFDIRDYGGRADNGTTDNSVAVAAAITAMRLIRDEATQARAYIFFPSAPGIYGINNPIILEDPYVWLIGEGPGTRLQQLGAGSAIVVGIRTTEPISGGTLALDSTYKPDLFGKLDTSCVGSAGVAYGWRTNKNSSILFAASPFSHGPKDAANYGLAAWSNVNKLTIEWNAEYLGGGTKFPGGFVGGIYMIGGLGSKTVHAVRSGGSAGEWDLEITDAAGLVGTATMTDSVTTGPQRGAFFIDLTNRTCVGYLNGKQVAVTTSGALWSGSGSTTFWRNERDACLIGVTTQVADGRAPVSVFGGQTEMDVGIYGFQFFIGNNPYTTPGTGGTQARTDAGTVNDNFRYGVTNTTAKPSTGIVANLYWPSNPQNNSRLVPSYCGATAALTHGYFIQMAMYSQKGGLEGCGLKDMRITGRGGQVAPTVAIGPILDFRVEGCTIDGGTQALGTLHMLANYPQDVRDCSLTGTDCGWFGAWTELKGNGIKFLNSGRAPIIAWASNASVEDVNVAHANDNCQAIVMSLGGLYGGDHSYRHWTVDFEGQHCSVAPFVFDQFSVQHHYIVDDVYLGSAGDTVPVFLLRTLAGGTNTCDIRATMINAVSTAFSHSLVLDGSGFVGTVQVRPTGGAGMSFSPTNGATNNVSLT